MRILVIADPVWGFNLKKDTTYAMMREAAARGHDLLVCEPQHLQWRSGGRVSVQAQVAQLTGRQPDWVVLEAAQPLALADVEVVLMRKDPPFDAEYIYATHLLEQAEREGACVVNRPAALRDHPEKLAVMAFDAYAAPTLVTRQMQAVRAFHAEHGDIILKPLDGMGGRGIFRVKPDGLNLGAIVESLTQDGQTTIMVQRFLPEIAQGDKRILLIEGQPVPFCLARIPQGSEVRGNLAVGGKGVAQALSPSDLALCQAVGPSLAARGLLLVGLDVIGQQLTEVNVTSPTCFQEIAAQTGFDVAALFIDALERQVRARACAPVT